MKVVVSELDLARETQPDFSSHPLRFPLPSLRYGLLGENGSGKTTFLEALAARDVEIPEHIDVSCLSERETATLKP